VHLFVITRHKTSPEPRTRRETRMATIPNLIADIMSALGAGVLSSGVTAQT